MPLDIFSSQKVDVGSIMSDLQKRTGFLWGLLVALATFIGGAAAPRPATACPIPDDVVVTQSAWVGQDSHPFEVVAASLSTVQNDDWSRLVVLDARCRVVLNEKVDGLESRFELDRLGRTPILQFVTMEPAGDGTNYVHRLYALRRDGIEGPIRTIENTGKDGFYLGRLRSGPGEGVVVWTADQGAAAEAAPHPYVVRQWRWNGNNLVALRRYETTRTYWSSDEAVPRANLVAEAMSLPYRDQTGTKRFMDVDRLLYVRGMLATAGLFSSKPW